MSKSLLNNPFLILGVSSDAEMSEIKSIGKRTLMELRLDDDSDPAAVSRIEDALEALTDPVVRFEAGLFALELTSEQAEAFRADPVLSSLAVDPTQDGVRAYEAVCAADDFVTEAHNLGVLRFLQAVAATEEAQKGTPDDISDDLACVELWKDAYSKLRLAFSLDEFWMCQRLRAKSYADQRLTPDRVKEIQARIYDDVIGPVGDVIRIALLDRHAKVAKAYVSLLRVSGFDDSYVEGVLSEVYKPLADRVEREIDSLKTELRSGNTSASHYKKIWKRFKKSAGLDLRVMIQVGDLPGYAEEHARDTAASFLRELSVDAFNNTDDSKTPVDAIQLATQIVDSKSDKNKYKNELAQITSMTTFKPFHDRLTKCLQSDDLKGALVVLAQIIDEGGDEDGTLKILRKQISTGLATQLFNKGVVAAKGGNLSAARTYLNEALEVETDPGEAVLIRRAIAQLPSGASSSSSGCLVAAFQLLAFVVLSGIVGGAMHACSQ